MKQYDKLIEGALHLIPIYLTKFNLVDNQDAESDCYNALYKAAMTFDETKGIQFTTYAATCIYNALAYLKRTEKRRSYIQVVSIYDTASSCADEVRTIEDVIILRNSPDDTLKQKEYSNAVYFAIQKALDAFAGNDLSMRIITLWLESDCELKQVKLAAMTGISQSRVSKVLSSFKRILRLEIDKLEE